MPRDFAAAAPFPHDILTALRARPLIPLAAAVVLGIVAAQWLRPPVELWASVAACACALAIFGRCERLRVAGVLLAALFLGAALHTWNVLPGPRDPSHFIGQRHAAMVLTLLSPAAPEGSAAYVCRVSEVTTSDGVKHAVRGRARFLVGGLPRGKLPLAGQRVVASDADFHPLREATNWYQEDPSASWRRVGVHCQIVGRSWVAFGRPSWWVRVEGVAKRVRERIASVLDRAMPGSDAQRKVHIDLLGSMVFGGAVGKVDRETAEWFRRTGTIHLLVVSGAQISLIVVFVTAVMGAGRHLSWWGLSLLGLVLLWFGLIVGTEPSVLRALLMAAVALLAGVRGRRYDLPSAVALAALVLCLSDTSVVFSVGAQLTFAATVAVFVAAVPRRQSEEQLALPAVRRLGGGTPHQAALGTAGAWLLTTPILIHNFSSMALVGVAANLVVVPLSGLVLVVGLVAAVLGSLWVPLATLPCAGARVLLAATLWVVRRMSSAPLACVEPLWLHPLICWLWLLAAAGLLYLWRTDRLGELWHRQRAMLLCVAAVAIGLCSAVHAVNVLRPMAPRIMTFDVGEGQCTLIESPGRGTVLIDAGCSMSLGPQMLAESVVVPYLARRGIRRLDAVVISHADADHYGALEPLCRHVAIGWVILGPPREVSSLDAVLGAMTARGARIHRVTAGSALRIGGCEIQVLSPPAGTKQLSDNDASLVLRVEVGGHFALLPGDLEIPGMRRLLECGYGRHLRAEFLQVPHHGRESSALPEFYWAVDPRVAVVSQAGEWEQRGGEELCRRLCREVYSTEDCGAVLTTLGPEGLQVETFLPEAKWRGAPDGTTP